MKTFEIESIPTGELFYITAKDQKELEDQKIWSYFDLYQGPFFLRGEVENTPIK